MSDTGKVCGGEQDCHSLLRASTYSLSPKCVDRVYEQTIRKNEGRYRLISNRGGYEGQVFGNYRLLRFLGRGGFGEVYVAEHIYLNTHVAVKLLALQGDQEIHDLIRAEAHTNARLEHPHIVRILDFGFEKDIPYLVMTYAPRGTLRTLHPRGTVLFPTRIALYVKQIAQALYYAHQQKVVHRDVKPENVLLGADHQLLLSDFGISVAAHRTHSLHPQDIFGTTAYMAPEQAEGKARPASDQYALGVMVYEWLCGSLPFAGTSTVEIALKHQREQPLSLRKRKATISASLEQVVMKALSKEPRERFETILAFAEALQDVCEEAEIPQGSTIISYREHVDYVTTLAWSPNGQWLASGGTDGTVQIWEAKTGKTCQTYLRHQAAVNALSWSPDGSSVVSGSDDHTAHIWHASSGTHQLTYQGHAGPVDSVAWSPDGTRIASGSSDSTVQVWDAPTGMLSMTYRGHGEHLPQYEYMIHDVAWSPTGFYLASASEDGSTRVWDVATGKQLQVFWDSNRDRKGDMKSVTWLHNGTVLLAAGDWTIWLYDPITGKSLLTYTSPKKTLFGRAACSPNGEYVGSVEGDDAIRIWHRKTGKQYFTYQGHNGCWSTHLAWSPDGRYIASACQKEVYIWKPMKE